ncbi:MAG: phosphotransferase [Chthonomonas sp.]|nr:phosphotransferase [Chthonomonas sp.]
MLLPSEMTPRIFASDPATGAILMERIWPGTTLAQSDLSDSAKTEIFIGFRRAIANLPTAQCLPLADYFRQSALPDQREPGFLHGDLHPENILLGPQETWLLIDPKGLVGEPCFEAVAWLRNPLVGRERIIHLRQRLQQLHEAFGWSINRMIEWSLIDQLECDEPDAEFLAAMHDNLT